jgi:hypothetical protein
MWLLAGIGVLAVILVAFYAYIVSDGSFFFFGSANSNGSPLPVTDVVLSASAMLVGVVFGSMHEHLKGAKAADNVLRKALEALNSATFFRSVLASPIIFAAVYLAAQKQPDQVIALIFAFQNGFFCNAILQRRGYPK